MEEDKIQQIIRKTQRQPTECSCPVCRMQCRVPCLGTPTDIRKLIEAGYKDRLAPTLWLTGMYAGQIKFPVPMVQPVRGEDGWCAFFRNGLCELHERGLKPTEGKLSHHTIREDNFDFSRSLAWNVAKTWLDESGTKDIEIILKAML